MQETSFLCLKKQSKPIYSTAISIQLWSMTKVLFSMISHSIQSVIQPLGLSSFRKVNGESVITWLQSLLSRESGRWIPRGKEKRTGRIWLGDSSQNIVLAKVDWIGWILRWTILCRNNLKQLCILIWFDLLLLTRATQSN